ncbi:mannosyltransferase [Coprinopsis sp. MPI-PUGE-AT-0042]|nr:mannosyltransferase [Coprinopsis sp. MPI-PUGE-AT-0042]
MAFLLTIAVAVSTCLIGGLGAIALIAIWNGRKLRERNVDRKRKLFLDLGLPQGKHYPVVGFFHPYCNAGGGGERVLWTAIASIQKKHPEVVSVVYSGDVDATKDQILDKVKSRFGIILDPTRLHFAFLRSRYLVEDTTWPRFTLLGQSLGSMWLVWDAMKELVPDLYIDTMGYAFTFPVVALVAGIPVGAYVHYPTISTDMLARVKSRVQWHTNSNAVSSSAILSQGKMLYYRVFMYYYALCLRTASFLMVNSSWTKNHIDAILQHNDSFLKVLHSLPPLCLLEWLAADKGLKSAGIVYPPCDTKEISSFSLPTRKRVILSVAQFRPEKDHAAQLHAFHSLLQSKPEYKSSDRSGVRLVMIGGSRNEGDANRVQELRQLAKDLDLEPYVEFIVNASYGTVLEWLSKASIGLSTMVDEHFGINIVEFLAAGVIPVTHASGGPLLDIVVPYNGEMTGYHARTSSEFAEALQTALSLSPEQDLAMRQRARALAVSRFSEEEFEKGWEASGWSNWLRS